MTERIEAHDAYFDGDTDEPEARSEPLWRALPDPATEPDVTDPDEPPMDPKWGAFPQAREALERVLAHLSYKDLALATATLGYDVPFSGTKLGIKGYLSDIMAEERRLEIRDKAQRSFQAKQAAKDSVPFEVYLLEDIPESEELWLVEGLWPAESNVLVAAQYKSGKTTFALNLVRSLVTGEPFLGRFAVTPGVGRVGFLNYELPKGKFKAWGLEHGVPVDSLVTVHLRGRRNPFGVPEDMVTLGEHLRDRGVTTLVIDPFSNAFDGNDQDNNTQVADWWDKVQRWCTEYGIAQFVVIAHAGHNAERPRGASALGDKPDATITLTRPSASSPDRFMRALGRDVEIEDHRLDYDPLTRTLSIAGARKSLAALAKTKDIIDHLIDAVTASPGINVSGIEDVWRTEGVRFTKGDASKASRAAEALGLVTVTVGPRGSRLHHLVVPS